MKRALILLLSTLFVGCGYSEKQWQAQLGRYQGLAQQYQQEQLSHQETQKALAAAQERVAQLENQLRKLGFNLDSLQAQLQQEGTEKAQLAADLDQTQKALQEYMARAAQLEKIKARFELLRKKLQKLTDLGLKVEIRRNRMVIRLPGDVLFASGQATLTKEGGSVLQAVADVIRNDRQLFKRYFQVAGHTDNMPLKGGRFGDNWGLSVMRAREVLLYLIAPLDPKKGGGGLDPTRLHAAGYGETDPVETNDTAEGRQGNRRVELVLMPDVEEMLDLRSLI